MLVRAILADQQPGMVMLLVPPAGATDALTHFSPVCTPILLCSATSLTVTQSTTVNKLPRIECVRYVFYSVYRHVIIIFMESVAKRAPSELNQLHGRLLNTPARPTRLPKIIRYASNVILPLKKLVLSLGHISLLMNLYNAPFVRKMNPFPNRLYYRRLFRVLFDYC